jgi:hypothetical protein
MLCCRPTHVGVVEDSSAAHSAGAPGGGADASNNLQHSSSDDNPALQPGAYNGLLIIFHESRLHVRHEQHVPLHKAFGVE